MTGTFSSVEELLADARSRLARVDVGEAADLLEQGALIVDIRPIVNRAAEGEIPGSVVIERNHLEWRLHPESPDRVRQATPGQQWIVVCNEGYTSSLAADALLSLGIPATDLIGGYRAWRAVGRPTVPGGTPMDHLVHSL
jgi:rhodanese-related sulfurtransferase